MHSKKYRNYMHSNAWQQRRLAKLEAANWRCEYCGETDRLSVHHLTYERLGHEQTDDLIVLCKSCHWIANEMRKNPSSDLRQRYEAPQKPKPKISEKELKIERRRRKREMKIRERRWDWYRPKR